MFASVPDVMTTGKAANLLFWALRSETPAIHSGHHEVKQDETGMRIISQVIQRLLAVMCCSYRITLRNQQVPE